MFLSATIWPDILQLCACMLISCFSLSYSLRPLDCSPTGSSVHGISQTRVLEWADAPSSRGSSQPRDGTRGSYVSCCGRWVLFAVKTSHFWSIVCFVQWDFCHASLKSSVSGVLVYPCECSHWLWKQFFIVLAFFLCGSSLSTGVYLLLIYGNRWPAPFFPVTYRLTSLAEVFLKLAHKV